MAIGWPIQMKWAISALLHFRRITFVDRSSLLPTGFSRVILFWAAFILTRPLGATLGDFLDKPIAEGGLALSRYTASLALLVVIVALILIFRKSPLQKRIDVFSKRTCIPK